MSLHRAMTVALVAVGLTAGCVYAPVRHGSPAPKAARAHKPGPPPHAPAHGYRHKHGHGVELVFDSGLGVYLVVGRPDHYHHRGSYLRYRHGAWFAAVRLDGEWVAASGETVPPGLRKRHGKARRGHGPPAKAKR